MLNKISFLRSISLYVSSRFIHLQQHHWIGLIKMKGFIYYGFIWVPPYCWAVVQPGSTRAVCLLLLLSYPKKWWQDKTSKQNTIRGHNSSEQSRLERIQYNTCHILIIFYFHSIIIYSFHSFELIILSNIYHM